MDAYADYVRAQQAEQQGARPKQRAPTPEEEAGGGALMFGNRESTVDRKQRVKQEMQRQNQYNSTSAAQPGADAAPARAGGAAPVRASPAAGGRPGLPLIQPQAQAQQQPRPQQQQQQQARVQAQASAAPVRRIAEPAPVAGGAGGDDARFRSLERQCVELREEQREILGWLAKSEEALAAETAARERAEGSLRGLLEQTVKAQEMIGDQLGARVADVQNELSERLQSGEQQQRLAQGTFDRSVGALTDSISQLSSDLNALSFFVASGGSLGGARVAEIARARGAA